MRPVKQVTGYDCYDACVASILEIPLSDMPGARYIFDEDKRTWDEAWDRFLGVLNLCLICLDGQAVANNQIQPGVRGYAIAVVKGRRGVNHAVVLQDCVQVWDPSPIDEEPYPKSAWIAVEVFQVLDPARPAGKAALSLKVMEPALAGRAN